MSYTNSERNQIRLKAPIRPRADEGLLRRLLQDAWSAKVEAVTAQAAAMGIPAAVAAELARRYPAHDMAILKRYGAARPESTFSVSTFNPDSKRYDLVRVDLPEPMLLPDHGVSLLACAERFSLDPCRGIHAHVWAAYSETEKARVIQFQDEQERAFLPDALNPFFAGVIAARNAYRRESGEAMAWPSVQRTLLGRYPTWAELVAAFDVLGAHIMAVIAEPVSCAA